MFDAVGDERGDVLAMTIDGVGTKLKVACQAGRYASVGADLVNHCTDDLLVSRARPILFADYFATTDLEPAVVAEAVGGMAEACRAVGCSLVAGETAEMPGVYCEGEIDLVGCMIGLARKSELENAELVQPGDVLLGLPSTGLHTNGYSLARHLCFSVQGWDVGTEVPELEGTVGDSLLAVHREYLTTVEPLLGDPALHGMAHITGGGLIDNVVRSLPEGCEAHIDTTTWQPLPIFNLLVGIGELPKNEAYRTFNMGVGYVLIVAQNDADRIRASLTERGETVHQIGEVREGRRRVILD
jgi:phosphoribosylformylglycinamidine cyclo-ligase